MRAFVWRFSLFVCQAEHHFFLFFALLLLHTHFVCVLLLLFYCNWSCPWMSIKYHFITALQCIIIVYTGTSSMSLLRKRFNEMKWIFLCFYSSNAKSNNWRRRLDRCAFADLEKNAATTHTTLHSMLELRIKLNSCRVESFAASKLVSDYSFSVSFKIIADTLNMRLLFNSNTYTLTHTLTFNVQSSVRIFCCTRFTVWLCHRLSHRRKGSSVDVQILFYCMLHRSVLFRFLFSLFAIFFC